LRNCFQRKSQMRPLDLWIGRVSIADLLQLLWKCVGILIAACGWNNNRTQLGN
jgi:hypothetical protein